jgi:hypothetical protein
MLFHGVHQPTEARGLRGVARLQLEDGVGAGQVPAALDERFGHGIQTIDPRLRDNLLKNQLALVKVELLLLLGQDARRVRKDFLRLHVSTSGSGYANSAALHLGGPPGLASNPVSVSWAGAS